MLGHELRNPLAPIATALRVMELRDIAGAEHERAVIGRQVERLTRLVDDLLDVSRIASGKVELSTSPMEIADIVAEAIEVTSPLLEQRGQRLRVSVGRPGLVVRIDPQRMTQVLSNLLTNASKYSDTGGEIRIGARAEGTQLVLRVEDAGIGIEPEMLPRVFDLFTQEHQSLDRSRGGLGLGLAIVRNLVTMHGGSVTAESEGRGRGSAFTVILPLCELASAPGAEREPAVPAVPHRSDGRRVMIVDDNVDAAEMVAEMLRLLGHVTQIAPDGPTALRAIEAFAPDVALLDIGLPVMDGYELARQLRAKPGASNLRLFAVTGYGQDEDRRRSRDAGFDGHLVKPLDLDAVVRAVEGSRDAATGATGA
jgi:CheY-like chemotaxis protein